jgi:hypothetical protein
MSEKHTRGLLKVTYSEISKIKAENGAVVATCHRLDSLTNLEANARRFAACWNACDGLDTSSLETGALQRATAEIIEQRDELLEALQELREAIKSRGVISTVKALSKADAAIAKATGGAA